jgi:hypothetical protein
MDMEHAQKMKRQVKPHVNAMKVSQMMDKTTALNVVIPSSPIQIVSLEIGSLSQRTSTVKIYHLRCLMSCLKIIVITLRIRLKKERYIGQVLTD